MVTGPTPYLLLGLAVSYWAVGVRMDIRRWRVRAAAGLQVFDFVHGVVPHRISRQRSTNSWLMLATGGATVLAAIVGFWGHWVWIAFTLTGLLLVDACLVVREALIFRPRSTLYCTAAACALASLAVMWPLTGSMLPVASLVTRVFVAQMYLVSALRKLGSRDFLSGRVVADNLIFGQLQRRVGNPEFIHLPLPPTWYHTRVGLSACRAASILALAAEALLAVLVAFHFAPALCLVLACVTHAGFTILAPRRIVSFSLSSVALVSLAVAP